MTMYINQIVLNRYDLYLKTVSTCIVACVSGSFPGMDLHKFYMTPLLNTKELHDPPPICPSENYMTPPTCMFLPAPSPVNIMNAPQVLIFYAAPPCPTWDPLEYYITQTPGINQER